MDNRMLTIVLLAALIFAGFAFGNVINTLPTGKAVENMGGPMVRNSESHKEALYWPASILALAASTIILALAVSKRGKIRF